MILFAQGSVVAKFKIVSKLVKILVPLQSGRIAKYLFSVCKKENGVFS